MKIHNSKELIAPDKLRLKILIYGNPGTGKTLFASTAPNCAYLACETGSGGGILTIAEKAIDYAVPESLSDVEQFCEGKVFPEKSTLVLDSLSEVYKRFIKDAALQIPRTRGESDKRRKGIPELDDYMVMGELCRKLLLKLDRSNPDKHIIVTATEKYDKPGPDDPPGTEARIGPDLPGAMFMAAPAMFDLVLRIKIRQALKDPKDARSKYSQRYLLTQNDGLSVVKSRNLSGGKSILDPEEVFDIESGKGCFPYLLDKLSGAYNLRRESAGI